MKPTMPGSSQRPVAFSILQMLWPLTAMRQSPGMTQALEK
jgi:hypothetical protein